MTRSGSRKMPWSAGLLGSVVDGRDEEGRDEDGRYDDGRDDDGRNEDFSSGAERDNECIEGMDRR